MSQQKSAQDSNSVTIRPSIRLVRPIYSLSFLLVALVYGFNNNRAQPIDWLVIFPLLLLAWTVWRHIRLRFTTLTLEGGRLRYQSGMLSKTTRAAEVSRVQDVQVTQSVPQRLLDIGDIAIETAGDSGRLTMRNVDRPHAIADFILDQTRR